MKKGPIIALVCILAALVLAGGLYWQFGDDGQGTRISYTGNEPGFRFQTQLYTENGATEIVLSGHVTVKGTAVVSVTSEDGAVVYSKTLQDVKDEEITVEAKDLKPNAYYDLRFIGDEAQKGFLFLATENALVKQPEKPEHGKK